MKHMSVFYTLCIALSFTVGCGKKPDVSHEHHCPGDGHDHSEDEGSADEGSSSEGSATATGINAEHEAARPVIAVIPKGTSHVFWRTVESGALKAGEELKAEIRWKGPLKENDRAMQIEVVQQFISERVDAIVLAPLDDVALQASCRAAMQANIPVVIFDSALKGEQGLDFISFVATDNTEGGRMGGAKLAELMGNTGKMAILRYQVGSASTEKRESGALESISGVEGIEVISDNQYAGATVGEAITVSENMLDVIKEADGIFTPNESATVGMLTTLQRHNLAGKVKFVGFDASETLVAALKDGEIDALVVQNPAKMGYLGVKTAFDYLHGKEVTPVIDTGVALVTRENMDTPEMAELIK